MNPYQYAVIVALVVAMFMWSIILVRRFGKGLLELEDDVRGLTKRVEQLDHIVVTRRKKTKQKKGVNDAR